MEARYKKLGKNTMLVFMGNAGSKLISIIMLPLYTKFLPPEEFGISDIICTYSSILLAVITCCVSDGILLYSKGADKNEQTSYFTSGIIFSICSFLLFGIIFFLIKTFIFNTGAEGTFISSIWWIYAMTASVFFQNYSLQFALSLEKVVVYSISGIVLTGLLAVLGLILIPIYGIHGYLYSLTIAHFGSGLFTLIFSKAFCFFSIHKFDFRHLTSLLTYGIPLIPNSIMWFMVNGINRPIMEATIGLSAVGIYAVANKFPGVISTLCNVFSSAWGISLLEEFHKPDFNHFFNKTAKFLFFVMILGGAFLTIFSKLIVSVFADTEYYDAWKYMPILVAAVIFQNFASIVGGVFMADKKSKYFFYSSVVAAVASIGLTIALVNIIGLMGVCIAVAISFLLMLLLRIKFAWKHIYEMNIKYYFLMTSLYAILAIVVILDINLFVSVVTFVITTVCITVCNKEELRMLSNSVLKINKKL